MAKGKKNLHPDSEPYRVDDTGWRVKCVECGNEFDSKRSDAAYCSGKCRTHASRAPKRRATAIETLRIMCLEVTRISKSYRYDAEMFDCMVALKKTVEASTNRFEFPPLTD